MAYSKKEIETKFDNILKEIGVNGLSLRATLDKKGMPDQNTFYKWINEDEDKKERYARACEDRADKIFEEIIDIADDQTGDIKKLDDGREVFDGEFAARSRIKIDARKWVLSKMIPKTYGDKNTTTIEGGEKPIIINFED